MIGITEDQLAGRPKRVGKVGDLPVFHAVTKGGFHLYTTMRKGRAETLGTGSHPALARHVAEKVEPGIVWEELNKSDHLAYEHFAHLVPAWTAVTMRMRRLRGF